VIRSSAVNNDGGGLTLTAPSGDGQQRVIAEAYRRAGIDPQSIGYVEAHAAGTAIGDAVELRSLTHIFGRIGRTIPIGSVKSNLGHCFHAAGIASVAKVLLCLSKGQIPPTLHCETPARRIGFETTPFRPVGALTDWPANERPRRAAINSFGLGGTNVHLVLEEGPKPPGGRKPASRRSVFCLRAPAGELARVADHYRRHIDGSEGEVAGVCSASYRRGQWMPERSAFAAGSQRELSRQLASIAAGQTVKPRNRPDAPVFVMPGLGSHLREEVTFLFKEEREFLAMRRRDDAPGGSLRAGARTPVRFCGGTGLLH
jgi:acyl transferase domain-containing protein